MNLKPIIITTIVVLLMCSMTSATTYTVGSSGCDYTTIQAAVTAASEYDTVYVYNGTYTENVNVGTANLTIEGEGRDVVTVQAASSADHVFEVTADYVNISGFTAAGATETGEAGIFLDHVDHCHIDNNNASSDYYGIHLYFSSYNNVTNNMANLNLMYGIYLYGEGSNYNNVTNNMANSNMYQGILDYSGQSGNACIGNTIQGTILYRFSYLQTTFSYLQTDTQECTVGSQTADFNFTMKDINGYNDCSSCTYSLTLSPPESSLQSSKNGALVIGNFTPTRQGLYSLTVRITDPNDNVKQRKYIYLVNSTGKDTVDYYFRHVLATHGQPTNYGSTTDAGSLLFEPPISEEEVHCDSFVGLSIDVLPDHLFGIFRNINYSIWYKIDNDGNTGIDRYGRDNQDTDLSIPITSTPKIFDTFSFIDVNWSNDYVQPWYFVAIKLYSSNGIPYIYTNATHPSYANMTYDYSTTPLIKSISTNDIISATSPADDDTQASIVLDGSGATNIVVQMPNTALTYTATWDGGACTGGDCSFTQSSGELNFTLTLGSEHTIDISEASAGTNDIVLGANKYGMLRKSVTSAQSFSTIAGEFSHDICFTWWDSTNDRWESYYSGDSYNSAKSVPEHDSYFVLMDGTGETVSCSVAAAENVDIPIGWSSTYLRESASKSITAIKSDMGGNCADVYAWDSTASGTGAWTNTGTFSVSPNQGILVDASSGFTWDGSVS